MIEFFLFLLGAAVGMMIAISIASSGENEREKDAYEQGKQDGFYEGMMYNRRGVIDDIKHDK